MAHVGTYKHSDYLSRRRAETREYWFIFCIAYVPLLLTAITGRLVALAGHHPRGEAGPRRSVFAEAKAAAAACIPFAFM